MFASVGLLLATPRQVLSHVATNGVAIVVVGLALAAAAVATAVGAALLIGALRAMRLDPSQALREL